MLKSIVRALASLRLTVVLLALAMGLIFMGTLAQVRVGVWEAVDTYFRTGIAWVDPNLIVPEAVMELPFRVPYPGGAAIGLMLLLNLVAAHIARFKLSARRAGVLLLHGGLIVLLLGEFATSMLADEGMMSIDEGQTASSVEDVRSVELAVIDHSDSAFDRVVTVPQAMLERASRGGDVLSDARLPFDLEVLEWLPNARLLKSASRGHADRGVGLEAVAERLPIARGVDGSQIDAPAAYIRLSREGRPLGVWLVWANLIDPQPVEADGVVHGVSLRYRRTIKPYEVTLLEFRHDTFVGTQIARNFSSRVRLVDRERGIDRETIIWMNNPLRYRGDTLYQASYKPDGSGTVLQVVRNPGAALPYVASGLVGGGMLLHFGLALASFLQRRGKVAGAPRPTHRRRVSLLHVSASLIGIVLAGAGLFRPAISGAYDLDTFARIPVSSGGRVKPLDTAARHVLMVAGGRQSIKSEAGDMEAIEYLACLMARPEQIASVPAVRIDHPEVLAIIGLTPEQAGRIPLAAIEPHWSRVVAEAQQAFEVDSKRHDPYQRAVTRLYIAVDTLLLHARMREPYTVAPLDEARTWRSFHDAFLESRARALDGELSERETFESMHPSVAYLIAMMTAYAESDAEAFNRAVGSYDALLRREMPEVMRRSDLEVRFNRARLFAGTTAVYVGSFLLVCLSLLLRARSSDTLHVGSTLAERIRISGVGLLWGGLIVHTLAIAARVYLQDRPPVTNLYSSALFVGWAAVLFGGVIERLYPIGIAALGAACVGFATLIVAHNLGNDGDTMQMMQAVLDSNFWLATHVITITLGYSATFLAGTLGATTILLGVLTKALTRERANTLARMTYGTVCFSLLLSFVGTVLGGIWADQSWGRFWGWDPKENGAALVVLISAIILHARWGGIIRQRGLFVLAVGGNIVTSWSWFGTNMLGVGLHSYGFMDSAAMWLMAFVFVQLAIIAIGLLPRALWRSREEPASAARHSPPAQ